MKPKIISVLLALLLSISITACSSNKSSSNINNRSIASSKKISDTSVPTSQSLELEAYKTVLQNKVNFISTENKKNIYLNNFLNHVPEFDDWQLKVTHFTVIDMDGDKIPEVVLELSIINNDNTMYPECFEVLHYMNGAVYGYNIVYRGLESLKTDGTFYYSNGAADNGYGKLRFESNTYKTNTLGYSKSSEAGDKLTISYFINNKPVTEKSFNSFSNKQDEKKDVNWYDFSQNNIETKLSINS